MLEQRVSAIRPLRTEVIETEQQFQNQMENRCERVSPPRAILEEILRSFPDVPSFDMTLAP